MPFTSGTASDYHAMLNTLRTWLTGTVGWTQLRWTAPASLTDRAELWVRGPGAGATRQTFVGIESRNDLSQPAYSWAIRGAVNFDGAQTFGAQPGVSAEAFLSLQGTSMAYWFYANDRRVIVMARAGTNYIGMYAGFLLPFALPTEYPFPHCVVGNNSLLALPNQNNAGNRFFVDPGAANGFVRDRGGIWRNLRNHDRAALVNENNRYGASFYPLDAYVWPMRNAHGTASTSTGPGLNWTLGGMNSLRPNINGESPLMQCHVMRVNQPMLGAMDGVFAITGFNRTSEQIVTSSGRTFRLFQNVFRSTARDFMAVEEI